MVKITSFEDAFHGLSNILFEKDPNPVKQSDLSRVERSARGTERKHTVSKEKTRDRIFQERRSRDAEPRKVEIDGRPPAPIQAGSGPSAGGPGRSRPAPSELEAAASTVDGWRRVSRADRVARLDRDSRVLRQLSAESYGKSIAFSREKEIKIII